MFLVKKFLVPLVVGVVRFYLVFYTYLTLPIYYLAQRPWRRLRIARECGAKMLGRGKLGKGDNVPPGLRGLNYIDFEKYAKIPYHPMLDCNTPSEAFDLAIKLYPIDRPTIAYREILAEEVQFDRAGNPIRIDGKLLRKYRLSDYRWLTLGEVNVRVMNTFRGLTGGLCIKKGEVFAIYSETGVNYFTTLLGAVFSGSVLVTLFHTMNDEGIIQALNETKVTCMFTTFELLDRVADFCGKCSNLKTIIYAQGPQKTTANKLPSNLRVLTLNELWELGRKPELANLERPAVSPSDKCAIMYTSGTTGRPKGVIITNEQLVEAAMAIGQVVRTVVNDGPNHIYIAYLPQAHVLEISIELFLFIGAVRIGYATPFTLNESAPGLAAGCRCDLQLLKPTVMAAVPLVLDRMQKEIDFKLKARTPFSKDIFDYLISYKQYWLSRGYLTPIVDRLMCPKVQQQFGGRLEYLVVGSAPLAGKLQSLIKCSLNAKLLQGYGATETSGGVFCMDFDDLSVARVGAPLNGVRARLVDWPEGGYSVSDKPNPRGELIVGGKMISQGYYAMEAETKDAFFDEKDDITKENIHFFVTGDIGELYPGGTMKIIDRKKDLVKLANGEYFSLGKIESILKSSRYVDNFCIIPNSLLNCLVGLVVPNPRSLVELATQKLRLASNISIEDICRNSNVKDEVHRDIIEVGFSQGLKPIELPSLVWLCSEEWSPDNNLLTAAMKLKRVNIHRRYREDLDRMFTRLEVDPTLISVKRILKDKMNKDKSAKF